MRIDHAGKDLKKGARGTSAKNDDVDLVWQMTRIGDNVKLHATKKRHTWIKDIELEVTKSETMFIQNHVKSAKRDLAIGMINKYKIPTIDEKTGKPIGTKRFWNTVKETLEAVEDIKSMQKDFWSALHYLNGERLLLGKPTE